jgi:hypothetical protein
MSRETETQQYMNARKTLKKHLRDRQLRWAWICAVMTDLRSLDAPHCLKYDSRKCERLARKIVNTVFDQ